jgi:hypothetical protein
MKAKFLLSTMIITIAFASCKKGDTGPAGATGATGATGNANVQALTFTIDSTAWVADTTSLEWSAEYSLPSATNVSGGVFLYVQDDNNWAALPHVDYGIAVGFAFDPSTKIIEVQEADAAATAMVPNPASTTFKVIIIPPAIARQNPNVDMGNYREVKAAFNLSK